LKRTDATELLVAVNTHMRSCDAAQAPPHVPKSDDVLGVASRVTDVPGAKFTAHVPESVAGLTEQLIPAAVPTTVPLPSEPAIACTATVAAT
jgi:hypothetical protein